jgi:hypothetical protein
MIYKTAHKIILIIITIILYVSIFPCVSCGDDSQQLYYGFFASKKGKDYKRFVHNIFGFSIDIPSSWMFGVNGIPPTAVILLYPDGLNTAEFSKDYETIEVGKIPYKGISLDEAYQIVMKGMIEKHPLSSIVQKPTKNTINGLPAISWIYEWQSKTGYFVIEYITLVQCLGSMRSIAVRTTRRDYTSRMSFYDGILVTFQPFESKY